MSLSLARPIFLRHAAVASPLRASLPGLRLASRRLASTQSLTPQENITLLNSQREKRPSSPHFTIYKPQLTWIPSIFNRVTGVGLSVGLYAGALLYLLHPLVPAIDSAHLVSIVHDLPAWFKIPVKGILAATFSFHTFNGVRHLVWDMGRGLTLKGSYRGIYVVLASTAVSTIYLTFFV